MSVQRSSLVVAIWRWYSARVLEYDIYWICLKLLQQHQRSQCPPSSSETLILHGKEFDVIVGDKVVHRKLATDWPLVRGLSFPDRSQADTYNLGSGIPRRSPFPEAFRLIKR